MASESHETDQHLASRIRALLGANAFVGDFRDLVIRYQERANRVNGRLTAAREWLRGGLLSEAIHAAEEYRDAIETARYLDLGRENMTRLVQGCREFGVDVPTGVLVDAAWELSTAYVMYAEARDALDRYREACMTGAPASDRLGALRDACRAAAKTKGQLGPPGDSVERSLARQGPALAKARLAEISKEAAVALSGADVGLRDEACDRFAEFMGIVDDLNKSHADIGLDVTRDPALSQLQHAANGLVLRRLVGELKGLNARVDVEGVRAMLKRIEEIRVRGVQPDKAEQTVLDEARGIVEADDRKNDRQKEEQEELAKLIADPASTREQRGELFERLSDGSLRIPEELKDAYNKRNEEDAEARRRLVARRWKRGLMVGAAAAVVIGGIGLVGAINAAARRSAAAPAEALARVVSGLLSEGRIPEAAEPLAIASGLDDGQIKTEEADKRLAEWGRKLPDQASPVTRDQLAPALRHGAMKKLVDRVVVAQKCEQAYDEKLRSLLNESGRSKDELGREKEDVERADSLVTLARQPDMATHLEEAEDLQKKIKKVRVTTEANETQAEKSFGDITERLRTARAAGQQSQKGLLGQYNACIREFETVTGERVSLSSAKRAELEVKRGSLVAKRDEIQKRIAVTEAVQTGGVSLKDLVAVYSAYVEHVGAHNEVPSDEPALDAALRSVLEDGESLTEASGVYDTLGKLSGVARPADASESESRLERCDARFAGLFPSGGEESLRVLRLYFQAYQTLYTAPSSFEATRQEFSRSRWKQFQTLVDDEYRRFWTLEGKLSSAGPDTFDLSECPSNNKDFGESPRLLGKLVKLAKERKPETTKVPALAGGLVELMIAAESKKVEPLTAHLVAAERIRRTEMPTPLKAKRMLKELEAQQAFAWPELDRYATMFDRIKQASARLGDDVPWVPKDTEKTVRDAFSSFEGFLADSKDPSDLAELANVESQRLARLAAHVSSVRVVGVAWRAHAGGVVWWTNSGKPAVKGVLYRVRGPKERPELQPVGAVDVDGIVTWEPRNAPPPADGTPLLVAPEPRP